MTNFNEMKNANAVKNAAREEIFTKIMEFLSDEYGTENVSLVGSNEVAVCVGTRKNSIGEENEVCVVLKPTAKDFEDRKTTKKTFVAFDRLAAATAYTETCTEKAEKEAEKAAKKAEKIAKDSAAREQN